jgi:hypothetical protein
VTSIGVARIAGLDDPTTIRLTAGEKYSVEIE